MSVSKVSSIKPVRYKTDKNGNKIAVFRGGIVDNNKYARKTPFEKEIDANMGNKDYKPSK